MPFLRHERRQGAFSEPSHPILTPPGSGLGESHFGLLPSRFQEPGGFEPSQRLVQGPVGRQLVGVPDLLDAFSDGEAVKLAAALSTQVQPGGEDRLFDWQQCTLLPSHEMVL